MKPVIAITMEPSGDVDNQRPFKTGHRLDYLLSTYSDMVRDAGALPLLLPVGCDESDVSQLLRRVDGLLMSGGADLDPALWGEQELEPGGNVQPLGPDERARSRWEHGLVPEALALGLPILGVCRGLQQLNVSLGGSLWQDLERQIQQVGHLALDPFALVHAIRPTAAANGLGIAMAGAWVTSTHHQGLREVARGLDVIALAACSPTDSPDALAEVVEAVRLRDYPYCVGVQWHPERMRDSELTRALRETFIQAVRQRNAGSPA